MVCYDRTDVSEEFATSAYVKSYDSHIKWMYFLIEDDELLEEYNTIWNKISSDIRKELDSKPVNNKHFLKTKIKSYGDEAIDFQEKKILRLALIILVL